MGLIKSIYLSRALNDGEQLDFSVIPQSMQGSFGPGKRDGVEGRNAAGPGVLCALYQFSSNGGTPAGCMTLEKPSTCFELWEH